MYLHSYLPFSVDLLCSQTVELLKALCHLFMCMSEGQIWLLMPLNPRSSGDWEENQMRYGLINWFINSSAELKIQLSELGNNEAYNTGQSEPTETDHLCLRKATFSHKPYFLDWKNIPWLGFVLFLAFQASIWTIMTTAFLPVSAVCNRNFWSFLG